jgi:hypothetical protein
LQTSTASYNFSDDDLIGAVHYEFLKIFQFRNLTLQIARNDLSSILNETTATTQNRFVQTLTSLRTEESRFQIQLNRENLLSVCIQNLQSLMDNTLSLSGFRLSNCAATLEFEFNNLTSITTNNFYQLQLETYNIPFLFMSIMQGTNILNEEQIINAWLDRLVHETNVYHEWPIMLFNVLTNLRNQLNLVNQRYETCTDIAMSHFSNTIVTLEQRLRGICNALE